MKQHVNDAATVLQDPGMRRRSILIASASSLLGACATRGSVTDGSLMRPSQGLLAFKIESNTYATLEYTDLAFLQSVAAGTALNRGSPGGSFAITQGEAYFVTPVDPGEYMWSRFKLSWGLAILRNNKFVVKTNAITYIGHIRLSLAQQLVRLAAADREDDMRAHLREKFPKFLQTMSFDKAIAEMRV